MQIPQRGVCACSHASTGRQSSRWTPGSPSPAGASAVTAAVGLGERHLGALLQDSCHASEPDTHLPSPSLGCLSICGATPSWSVCRSRCGLLLRRCPHCTQLLERSALPSPELAQSGWGQGACLTLRRQGRMPIQAAGSGGQAGTCCCAVMRCWRAASKGDASAAAVSASAASSTACACCAAPRFWTCRSASGEPRQGRFRQHGGAPVIMCNSGLPRAGLRAAICPAQAGAAADAVRALSPAACASGAGSRPAQGMTPQGACAGREDAACPAHAAAAAAGVDHLRRLPQMCPGQTSACASTWSWGEGLAPTLSCSACFRAASAASLVHARLSDSTRTCTRQGRSGRRNQGNARDVGAHGKASPNVNAERPEPC